RHGQARRCGSRVRLVYENRGRTPTNKTRTADVPPAFLQQRGFTYIGLLIIIAIMGMGLAAFGELYSHAAQRDKERELLFVADQAFEGAEHYADWAFTYSPPGLARSIDRDRSR